MKSENVILVDAMGEPCPFPVVKAKKALDQARAGEKLEVHVDNDVAVENLLKMARNLNCECSFRSIGEKHFAVTITAADGEPGEGPKADASSLGLADCACGAEGPDGYIVVVDSDAMGRGDDKLGRVLMKGFIYALSQLEHLPQKVIFYNSGIRLTTAGSDSVEDLKSMEERGTGIFSCGTCLDYYGKTQALMVGEVTNMYNIVEMMSGAGRIVRP